MVFHAPPALVEAGYDPKAALIKRVVGQPGDAVEVRDALRRAGLRAEADLRNEKIFVVEIFFPI